MTGWGGSYWRVQPYTCDPTCKQSLLEMRNERLHLMWTWWLWWWWYGNYVLTEY